MYDLKDFEFQFAEVFFVMDFFFFFNAHVWIYIYTNYNPMIYRLLILSNLTIRVTQLKISLFIN